MRSLLGEPWSWPGVRVNGRGFDRAIIEARRTCGHERLRRYVLGERPAKLLKATENELVSAKPSIRPAPATAASSELWLGPAARRNDLCPVHRGPMAAQAASQAARRR